MLTFWTKERQITFDKLKSVLANKAVVKIFDHKKEITVTTDASEHWISGTLSNNVSIKMIEKAEFNYSTSRKRLSWLFRQLGPINS